MYNVYTILTQQSHTRAFTHAVFARASVCLCVFYNRNLIIQQILHCNLSFVRNKAKNLPYSTSSLDNMK